MMKKFKKSIICFVLVMSLLLGTSLTAFASSGNATYGGATIEWSMSSSTSTNKLSYRATANLQVKGQLYVKNNVSGIASLIPFESDVVKKSSETFTIEPGLFSSFISNSSNSLSAYINNSCFITYSPQP